MADVGATMRALREKKGISLRELARRLNLSAPFISDMELGRRNWCKSRIEEVRAALSFERKARR